MGEISHDSTIVRLFQRFNLEPSDLQELMQVVCRGGAMDEAGVPPALRQVIRDLHYQTWFTTRFSDGTRMCKTLAGSRPGESLADTVFAYIYSKLLCRIYESAAAEGLAFSLFYDPGVGPYGTGMDGSEQVSWDGTWADDSAFPTVASNPAELLQKAVRLSEVVLGACQSFGLTPNMKVGKTSMLLRLRGPGVVAAKKAHFIDGATALHVAAMDVAVPVVPQYRHLGGILDAGGTMVAEARHRIAWQRRPMMQLDSCY